MPNPFKKPESDERRNLWQMLTQPSATEVRDAEDALATSRAVVEWCAMPYHQRFLDWLREQADRPVAIDQHLIANTARLNTFKEVRKHLIDLDKRAHMALGESDG